MIKNHHPQQPRTGIKKLPTCKLQVIHPLKRALQPQFLLKEQKQKWARTAYLNKKEKLEKEKGDQNI